MAGIGSKRLSEIYGSFMQIDNTTTGIDTTTRAIKDGNGTSSALSSSTNKFQVTPQASDATDSVKFTDKDGNSLFVVDTTNDKVKAGIGQIAVNTQYAYFGIACGISSGWAANKHYALPFAGNNHSTTIQDDFDFGTGTDPATTFTTAAATATHSALLVPVMWFVPDNIVIDGVYSIEGADTATGDTTRMHLYSYTFTSGSTSALSYGTLLAYNSDVTNAGSEQAYLSTWTVSTPDVSANKVIVAFFRSDSINSDYSLNVTVKYHIK